MGRLLEQPARRSHARALQAAQQHVRVPRCQTEEKLLRVVHPQRDTEEELDPQAHITDPGGGGDILRHGLERRPVEREDNRMCK